MILERPHARPEIAIVARHHAAFAAGGHDLVLAEGPGADMADRPDAAPLVARAMRLRAILDHLDTARGGEDRKSVVSGKRVSVRVDLGGRRIIKNTKNRKVYPTQPESTRTTTQPTSRATNA